MPQPGPLQCVADAAGVREPGLGPAPGEVLAEGRLRGRGQPVTRLGHHEGPDRRQLVQGVVGKVDVVRDPGAHAGIGLEERVHPVLVAGQDDDQVLALVLHDLEQDLDGLLTVVALVLRPVQVIGLVDEEHPAHGALEDLPGLRRGMPHVLADQLLAGNGHQVPAPGVTEPLKQFGHPERDRGLAGARAAGEAHVQVRPRRHEAEPGPLRVYQEQRGNLPDPGLDRGQPDQLAVQGIQDGVHAGVLPGLQKVDRPTLGQLLGGTVKWHYPWCPAGQWAAVRYRRGSAGPRGRTGGPRGRGVPRGRTGGCGAARHAERRPGAPILAVRRGHDGE